MRKIGIIALLLVTVQSVSAQVSISASASNGAGGQTVIQTDTIAGQRLWPDFHAVEVEGAMKVRFETADAEHPVGISYYANDFKAGKYVSKVENGVLKLRMQRSKEADSLQVTVRYNTLSAVKVSGAAVHFAGLDHAHVQRRERVVHRRHGSCKRFALLNALVKRGKNDFQVLFVLFRPLVEHFQTHAQIETRGQHGRQLPAEGN